MNQIAYIWGDTYIYWSGILVALGAACAVLTALGLRLAQGERVWPVAVLAPAGIFLSVYLARAIHWYCHYMQYSGLGAALSDLNGGGFSLVGVFAGVLISAGLLRLCRAVDNLPRLLDCIAPAAALGIAVGRLSCLFNSIDRSKFVLENESRHGLPWTTPVTDAAGVVQWRLATFFWESLAAFAMFALLLAFFFLLRRRPAYRPGWEDGNVFLLFLALYGAVEVVLDSTRYDASYLRSNGFVSVVQLVSVAGILTALVIYSVRSLRAHRLRWWHLALWGGFLALAGVGGYMEYYVQRHGDTFARTYTVMESCFMGTFAVVCVLWRSTLLPRSAAAYGEEYGGATAYEEPDYEEPAYEEPAYEEPAYEEPAYEETDYEEPADAAERLPPLKAPAGTEATDSFDLDDILNEFK